MNHFIDFSKNMDADLFKDMGINTKKLKFSDILCLLFLIAFLFFAFYWLAIPLAWSIISDFELPSFNFGFFW